MQNIAKHRIRKKLKQVGMRILTGTTINILVIALIWLFPGEKYTSQ